MPEIRALLDRPDPRSLGLVSIVWRDADGISHVSGLSEASAHRSRSLDTSGLEELVRSRNVLPASMQLTEHLPGNAAALWIGDNFVEQTDQLKVDLPPLPKLRAPAEGGTFSVGSPDELFVYLDRWVGFAFERFAGTDAPNVRTQLTRLMQWALPGDARTLAASWQTASDPKRELDLQLKVFGRRVPRHLWQQKLEKQLGSWSNPFKEVEFFVFTGSTGSDRARVAEKFHQEVQKLTRTSEYRSFKTVVETKARDVHDGDLTKDLLMKVGQKLVERSPLFVALSIESLGNLGRKIYVVDSVRHQVVLESLRWLRPSALHMISVDAEAGVKKARIMAEHPEDSIEGDPTEIEIPALAQSSDRHIDTTREMEWKSEVTQMSKELVPA